MSNIHGKHYLRVHRFSGLTFKVRDKDRIDDPMIWQSMLSLPNGFQWPPVFGVGMVSTGVFMGKRTSKVESGKQKCNLEPLTPDPDR